MNMAYIAVTLVHAYCRETWPASGQSGRENMGSMAFDTFASAFDTMGSGSHKYIPSSRLTEDLGEPQGAGVYGYVKMADQSYVLLTCKGPLAYWSGEDADKAAWGK